MKPFIDNRETPNAPCVYLLTNIVNGRKYYGQTDSLKFRMNTHKAELRSGIHYCKDMVSDFNTHGAESCELRIIEIDNNRSNRIVIERFLIKNNDNIYNSIKDNVKFIKTK